MVQTLTGQQVGKSASIEWTTMAWGWNSMEMKLKGKENHAAGLVKAYFPSQL